MFVRTDSKHLLLCVHPFLSTIRICIHNYILCRRCLVNDDINIPWFIETAVINSDKETCTYSVPDILYQNVWLELHVQESM